MRTSAERMREITRGNFEVEVLEINGRPELFMHSFGARPVSDGPYQPVDAADVRRRRVVFWARQDNGFAFLHCRVLWAALVDADGAHARLATSRASKQEMDGPTRNRIFERKISNFEWRSSHWPPTERKGFQWRVVMW